MSHLGEQVERREAGMRRGRVRIQVAQVAADTVLHRRHHAPAIRGTSAGGRENVAPELAQNGVVTGNACDFKE